MISVNFRDSRPIYEQVKEGFRQLILSGALRSDEKMPSVRELASTLAINPNTIQRAYRELEAEGYIVSVPGRGSFVREEGTVFSARKKELLDTLRGTVQELRLLGMSEREIVQEIQGGETHD